MPLPEAYSRVTNPERFRPLNDLALSLVARLRNSFDVSRREAFDLVPALVHPFDQARPPVTLTPAAPGAAPIAIGFTPFPGLIVRCGRWLVSVFPHCGCDACAATAVDEGARLERLVGDVVTGHFREQLEIPFFGDARLRWWLGSPRVGDGHQEGGMTTLSRKAARAIRTPGSDSVQWRPWTPRGS